jgi:hypothetical protein
MGSPVVTLSALESPCHVRQGGGLRAPQERHRLRREQELAEHERNTGADQCIFETLRPRLAVGHGDRENRPGGGLGYRDPRSTHRTRGRHRPEGGHRQRSVPTAQYERRRLSGRYSDDYPREQPKSVQAALSEWRVQRDHRRDRREEWLVMIDDVVRDHPGGRRGRGPLHHRRCIDRPLRGAGEHRLVPPSRARAQTR